MTAQQFLKVKKNCIRENTLPIMRLREAKEIICKFRDKIYKAIKKSKGRENLPKVPANQKHCGEYLSETFVPGITFCSTCKCIFNESSDI